MHNKNIKQDLIGQAKLQFSKRLREEMKGKTALWLAKETQLSNAMVRDYLSGRTTPNLERAAVIANVLGCSLSWLITGDGDSRIIIDNQTAIQGLGERFKMAMKGDSNFSVAEKALISDKALGNYIRGETQPTIHRLIMIANVLKCDAGWLAAGGKVKLSQDKQLTARRIYEDGDDYVIIERGVDRDFYKRITSIIPNDKDLSLLVSYDWLLREKLDEAQLGLFEIADDGMEPTLKKGDTVILNINPTGWSDVQSGIFALKINNIITVRRLQYDLFKGGYHVKSDNPNHENLFVAKDEINFLIYAKLEKLITSF